MTEQQLANVMGTIVTHQRTLLRLTNEEGTWIDQHAKEAMELFADVAKEQVKKEKELERFLRESRDSQGAKPKPTPSILELVSTVVVLATTGQFVAKNNFVVNTKRDAPVKIGGLGDNFKSWFGGKTEDRIAEQTLRYHKLRQSSVDGPIIAELGGEEKSKTTLSEMFSLVEKQSKGEDGVLLNNGWANIFYIEDQTGVLRAVYVYWRGDGWHVDAGSVEDPREWFAGYRVFSRLPDEALAKAGNSVLESSETSAPAQA